jgi:predicted TIM-barrel fold metal-dependent hydrolase
VDYPHVEFFKGLLAEGTITQEIYDKITYKNAQKLLGL